jgi:hypothetical protein
MTSRLLQILGLAYRYQVSDTDQLTNELLSQEKQAWRTVLREKAQQYTGFSLSPRDPSGRDLHTLKDWAREDAESIAATWNQAVERQLQRLFEANPKGNRYYYIKNMQAWEAKRTAWHSRMVSAQTVGRVREYAKSRFLEENGVRSAGHILTGPPPVCDDCIDLMRLGVVASAVRRRNPTPRHPNCDHEWEEVNAAGSIPLDELWLG